MSQENVDLVRRGIERFVGAGQVDWRTLHDDVEVHDHDLPDAGEYRGHAGFGRWLADWAAPWAEYSDEPEEFIDAGERVVVVIRMKATGRGSGLEVQRQDALLYELRNGKIARLDYYNNRQQALGAPGCTPSEVGFRAGLCSGRLRATCARA
jgi:ketosteroid isomerase-like protein